MSMNTTPAALGTVLLASDDDDAAGWLAKVVARDGRLERVAADPARLGERLAQDAPSVVVVDFGALATELAAPLALLAAQAEVPVVALGRTADGAAALAALRAGAREFIEMQAPPGDARRALQRLASPERGARRVTGKVIALCGARAGVGTSTLAVHLADLCTRALHPERRVALLDLGLPIADSLVMLETRGSYSFAEAARNLHRIDPTFVQSALPHHASGLAVLALPNNVAELRELTPPSAVAVIQRLRGLLDLQIVDLGGFASTDFVASVAAISDHCLMVCDQGAPSVVSATELARALRARQIKPQLVASKADPAVDPQPAQIAARLELPLAATLPQRSTALLQAMNAGRLLGDVAPQDAYLRALRQLAAQLLPETVAAAAPQSGVKQRLTAWMARKPA